MPALFASPARRLTVLAFLFPLILPATAQEPPSSPPPAAPTSASSPPTPADPCHSTGGSAISTLSAGCPSPYTAEERIDDFVGRTFGPLALARTAAVAAIDQWRDNPSGWEQGGSGYGRRASSKFGKRLIGNSVQLGVEALLREDSRFRPTGRTGFFPRLAGAFSDSFWIPTTAGRHEPPIGRLAGSFSSGMISRKWYPPGDDTVADGVQSGAESFGWHVLTNVLREFIPYIR